MNFKVGDTFKVGAYCLREKPTKIHIVAIIEGMIVYKWYSFKKRYWKYGIKTPYTFETIIMVNIQESEGV